MKTDTHWQRIAERLAESGWSWSHRERVDQKRKIVHVAEAHNENGQTHFAFAQTVRPAFVVLERSIQSAGNSLG